MCVCVCFPYIHCHSYSLTHTLADVAPGVKARLPPHGSVTAKQTQSNEIHCREPVSGTLGGGRRAGDRLPHTLYHVPRQSTNTFPPQWLRRRRGEGGGSPRPRRRQGHRRPNVPSVMNFIRCSAQQSDFFSVLFFFLLPPHSQVIITANSFPFETLHVLHVLLYN